MMYLTVDTGHEPNHVIEFNDARAARRAYDIVQHHMASHDRGSYGTAANIELEGGGVASFRSEYIRGVTLVKSRFI